LLVLPIVAVIVTLAEESTGYVEIGTVKYPWPGGIVAPEGRDAALVLLLVNVTGTPEGPAAPLR
jgi:hypothetical protein